MRKYVRKGATMKITVINGTEKHGVTYRLKEIFLENLKEKAVITEYYLPKDCPSFCTGCINCMLRGEDTCKDAGYIQKIAASMLEADLLVMTSPAYVFHVTGAMKALLDHFAYLWMPHRPAPEMFGKRAVIITQCLGAGAKSAAGDIKHSLSWWGISAVKVFSGKLMGDVCWERLTEKKRCELTKGIKRLSQKAACKDCTKPARTHFPVKIKFFFCRMLQKSLYQQDPSYRDAGYWAQQGWLSKGRPWKNKNDKSSQA